MFKIKQTKYQIALVIALASHAILLCGIVFGSKQLFAAAAAYNLWLMAALIIFTAGKINIPLATFLVGCAAVGLLAESAGAADGTLFGEYRFANMPGPYLGNVPLVIGIHWVLIIYCAAVTVHAVLDKLSLRLATMTEAPLKAVRKISFVTDAAMLTVLFDWIVQPAAVKLGWWTWFGNGEVPLYNYACRLVLAAALMTAFSFLRFKKHNIFAVHLFLIMTMFYMLIRTLL